MKSNFFFSSKVMSETFINNFSGNNDLHFAPNQKWNPI